MKLFSVVISVLMSANFAMAHFCGEGYSDLGDEAMIQLIEDLGAEIDTNSHTQKIMNMTFNRVRISRRKLNKSYPKLSKLNDATDEDIMPLLQDLVDEISQNNHRWRALYKVRRHLSKALKKLKKNRYTAVEIGILSYDGADPFSFGSILGGQTGYSTITVTNSGAGTISTITDLAFQGPYAYTGGAYPGTNGTCGTTLAAADSCLLEVEFQAPVTAGSYQGELMLDYFDGQENQSLSISLTGNSF